MWEKRSQEGWRMLLQIMKIKQNQLFKAKDNLKCFVEWCSMMNSGILGHKLTIFVKMMTLNRVEDASQHDFHDLEKHPPPFLGSFFHKNGYFLLSNSMIHHQTSFHKHFRVSTDLKNWFCLIFIFWRSILHPILWVEVASLVEIFKNWPH